MAACVFVSGVCAATEVQSKQPVFGCPLLSRVAAMGISDSTAADAECFCRMELRADVYATQSFTAYQGFKRSAIIPAAGWRDGRVIKSGDRQHLSPTARNMTNA